MPPLSVIKPLCGAEPRLYQCLRSFCDQDYPDYQIIFGVRESGDPSVAIVERLMAEYPGRDISLVCDARLHGANLKISNVMNILPHCRHDTLLISDSDVEVGSDCFRHVVAAMTDPKVGAVSCIYKGVGNGNLVSRLGAMNINEWIVPSILLDRALNGIDASLGPVMALRRPALDAIGGFAAVANYLAEDHEIGELLIKAGWKVRLSDYTIDTMVEERDLASLFAHEVRWAHTVRAVRPIDHILSLVTCVLPLLAVLVLLHPTWWGGGLLATYLALRLSLHGAVRKRLTLTTPGHIWLVPVREALCFAVWFYSLFSRAVVWRGQPFRLLAGGRLVPVDGGSADDNRVIPPVYVVSAAANSNHGPKSVRARVE